MPRSAVASPRTAVSPRAVLPQNYTTDEGTLFEDFETFEDFTLYKSTGSMGSISADTENYKIGTKALKITAEVRENGISFIGASKTISKNLNGADAFRLWIFKPADVSISNNRYSKDVVDIYRITIDIASTTDFSKRFRYTLKYGLANGWNCLQFSKADFENTGGESWDNMMIRLRIILQVEQGRSANITLDSLSISVEAMPRISLQFDNGWLSQYTEAFDYMNPRGVSGTIYIVSDEVGSTNRVTLAQMQEMETAGWTMANHTSDHERLTDKLNLAGQIASIGECRDWLEANGFIKGARHIAYPAGFYNADTFTAMSQLEMKTGRLAHFTRTWNTPGNLYEVNSATMLYTDSLATAIAMIDSAIAAKGTLMLYFHKIEEVATSQNWSIANFKGLIDYIVAKKVKCLTIDEWYEGLKDPRYRSVSLARTAV